MAASSGDAHMFPLYNARFRMVFPILDADGDLVTAAATLDTELSQDQGTFADATNEATEIATSSGMYYLDLVATEMDTKSTAGIVKTSTAGAKTTPFVLYPRRLPVIRTGTAQAGAATTITLDSGASATDSYYNGCYVNITNNSPANAQGQARRITSYVGSTKVATVEVAWGTNPSSASTFEILLPGDSANVAGYVGLAAVETPAVNVTQFLGTAAAAPTVAGVPKVELSTWLGVAPDALVSGLVSTQATQLGIQAKADVWTSVLAEAYATDGAEATAAQLLYMIWAAVAEFAIAGVTLTAKKLDGSTTAMTFTLNDATNPTSRTRAT